jgi:cyclic beta-1,2-glucan synthetase
LDWKAFKIHYRYRETIYHIEVTRTDDGKGQVIVMVDGVKQENNSISFVNESDPVTLV